ncbi:MAG: ABC transporter substrate-binding protein, partial [Beijerinckiaceae bacterium]
MSAEPISLSLALSNNERTRPILEGRFQPQGIRLMPTTVHPSEMFWRQLKFAEFDVSEMSMSSFFITTARGDRRFVGLPIYTMRHFFHTSILVRNDSGIKEPKDLVGKKIGVPEYQQTWAIWSRGVLEDEYGVQPKDIIWHMERTPDISHGGSTGFKAPPGVTVNQIPRTTNIGEMLVNGELDGTLLYLSEKNLVDRSSADISDVCHLLFADPLAESKRYYAKTGIYPINHAMVIKRDVHEKHPWAAVNIFHAFKAAKDEVDLTARKTLEDYVACGLVDRSTLKAMEASPKDYGIRSSREVLETISRYVHRQGLTDRI